MLCELCHKNEAAGVLHRKGPDGEDEELYVCKQCLDGDKSQKAGIPGRPPALTNPPPGCRFAPRCPKAKEICHRECPEFVEVRPGRFAACHMLGKEGI